MSDESNQSETSSVPYPEHAKLLHISEESQAIGEFIENLGTLGLVLCDKAGDGFGRLFPTSRTISEVLAQHFSIDLVKIEAEKKEMLNQCRDLGR